MFMSALWDTIFALNDTYENAEVFLIDNHIPALRFGKADNPVVFAAGFGADQWQSSVMLLTFFERLLKDVGHGKNMAGIAVRKAFKRRSVVIVPCVCPPNMKYEGETLALSDLSPFAKYLAYHGAGMLLCVGGENGAVYAPPANEKLPCESDTVGKILCACSKLEPANGSTDTAAKFCNWVSEKAGIPSYYISPHSLDTAAMRYTYASLEEMFVVSALL